MVSCGLVPCSKLVTLRSYTRRIVNDPRNVSMKLRQLVQSACSIALIGSLAACGGSEDVPVVASTAPISTFLSGYNQSLSAGPAASTSTLPDLFDDAFLDAGYTKAQLVDNLKQDSENLTANPTVLLADSVYPKIALENATVSQCDDASGICTLTATYVNAAPDGTSTIASVPIRFKDGKFRLYGDQKSA